MKYELKNGELVLSAYRREYEKWRRWVKTMEDEWRVIEVPVSVHAENNLRELRDMFATFYRTQTRAFLPNALMMFVLGVLAHLIAKVNKIEWEMEKK